MATAHDLLLHLRCHAPHLARRLDGIAGLGVASGVITVRVTEGSWAATELLGVRPELEYEAARVWGRPMRLALVSVPSDPEALPLPVLSTKHWNHVVFVAAGPSSVGAVAVPKPLYRDRWVPQATRDRLDLTGELGDEDGARTLRYPIAGAGTPADALLAILPELVDDLAEHARTHRSYAQLLTAFPGDDLAERLEARLYGIKEWGTRRTPGPILHKYLGRLHYLAPNAAHLGLRFAAAP